MNEKLIRVQTGFVQQCGTQINIMRLIGQTMKHKDNKHISIGDKENLQINKGVMQGSIISPGLFNIFL